MFIVIALYYLAPLLVVSLVATLLWRRYDLVKRRPFMQARQESLLREGRAFIDKGLKIEETAGAQGLKDDPVVLSEARKAYIEGISLYTKALALPGAHLEKTTQQKVTNTLNVVTNRKNEIDGILNYREKSLLGKLADMACGFNTSPPPTTSTSSPSPPPTHSTPTTAPPTPSVPTTPKKNQPSASSSTPSSSVSSSTSSTTPSSTRTTKSLSQTNLHDTKAATMNSPRYTKNNKEPPKSSSAAAKEPAKPKFTTSKPASGGLARASSSSKMPLKDKNGKTSSSAASIPPLKGIDPKMQEIIVNEILDRSATVTFDDIAGLELVKQTLNETVILPNLRPDIFVGLRAPPKGLLLFGPPGNGKTMIAKAVAHQCKSTFFAISASSLTSKWVGESEKLVRTLFAVARHLQPSIVFIDEIDSILTERSSSENEASRRLKTEFLLQFDGAATSSDDRILIMGATNRPQELDEAARRRLVKRIYVELPEKATRKQIIQKLIINIHHDITPQQLASLADATESYSGSDLTALCKEAALIPIRELGSQIKSVDVESLRGVSAADFKKAITQIRPSVSLASLEGYKEWNKTYGCASAL